MACTPAKKSTTADYDYMYITKQGIYLRPMVADLEIQKVRNTLSKSYIGGTILAAKESILAEFIKEFKCDLVVQPYFTTTSTTTNDKTVITVTVTGYAASYKNIRHYEPKDKEYFLPKDYFAPSQVIPLDSKPVDETEKKKKKIPGVGNAMIL